MQNENEGSRYIHSVILILTLSRNFIYFLNFTETYLIDTIIYIYIYIYIHDLIRDGPSRGPGPPLAQKKEKKI